MKRYLIFIGLVLFTLSCKKQKLKRYNALEIPPNQSVDINGDGTADFVFSYYKLATENSPALPSNTKLSVEGITAANQLLKDTINNSSLFLKAGDSIFKTFIDTTLVWSDSSEYLTRINWDGSKWEEYWSINATHNKPYYLVYKLADGASDKIGWVKLGINQDNGKITLQDFEETTDAYLIISD